LGGVDAARRAGEVGELLLLLGERELKVADVSQVAERAILERRSAAEKRDPDLGFTDVGGTHGVFLLC